MNYASAKSELYLQDATVNNAKPFLLKSLSYTENSTASPVYLTAYKRYGVFLLAEDDGITHLANTTFLPGYNMIVASGFGPNTAWPFQFDLLSFNATAVKRESTISD